MEPNPTRLEVRRRDAPFAPGDVVRYVGVSSSMQTYEGNQQEGIVLYCSQVWNRKWSPETQWACRVDWRTPERRRTGLAAQGQARYQARNLALVRPRPTLPPGPGWVWPQPEAMRADDV